MNYSKLILSLSFLVFTAFQAQAQHDHGSHSDHNHAKNTVEAMPEITGGVTDIIYVYGNCGMCKRTIENALADIKGVNSADWDVDTKVLTVNYNDEMTSKEEIKKSVAKVGYDTDDFRADDKVYNNLPGCCQYERPEK